MFSELPETHSDFRFMSRRIRDFLTGIMLILGAANLGMIMFMLFYLLYLVFSA